MELQCDLLQDSQSVTVFATSQVPLMGRMHVSSGRKMFRCGRTDKQLGSGGLRGGLDEAGTKRVSSGCSVNFGFLHWIGSIFRYRSKSDQNDEYIPGAIGAVTELTCPAVAKGVTCAGARTPKGPRTHNFLGKTKLRSGPSKRRILRSTTSPLRC